MLSKLVVVVAGSTATLIALILFLNGPDKESLNASVLYSSYFIDQANNSISPVSEEFNYQKTIGAPSASPTTPAPLTTPTITTAPIKESDASQLPTKAPTPTSTPVELSSSPTSTPIPTSLPSKSPTPIPTISSPTLFIKINKNLTTSSVVQKETATVSLETVGLAYCSIKVTLPSSLTSSAKGLEDKSANESGTVSWSWNINWNTKPGTAIINILCSHGDEKTSEKINIEIIKNQ